MEEKFNYKLTTKYRPEFKKYITYERLYRTIEAEWPKEKKSGKITYVTMLAIRLL